VVQKFFFSRLLLLSIIVTSVYANQQKETTQKTDDTEREIKTTIDRTKKILTSYGCVPTTVNKMDVFIVEPDSPVGQALLTNQLNIFNNATVFSYGDLTPLVVADKGLVDILTTDEFQSILTHETGHAVYKKAHSQKERKLQRLCLGLSLTAAVPLFIYTIYIGSPYFKATKPTSIDSLKALGAELLGLAALASNGLFKLWRERVSEKAADLYAVSTMQSKALASALEKMRKRETELYPVSTRNYEWQEKWCPWSLNHPALATRKKYIEAYQLPKQEPAVQTQAA